MLFFAYGLAGGGCLATLHLRIEQIIASFLYTQLFIINFFRIKKPNVIDYFVLQIKVDVPIFI